MRWRDVNTGDRRYAAPGIGGLVVKSTSVSFHPGVTALNVMDRSEIALHLRSNQTRDG